MGVYLSQPDTRKESCDGESKAMRYGASAMQGWRMNMEDAHITDPNFGPDMALFAVFDGHGGPEVAKFCEVHFGEQLKKNANFEAGDYEKALKETFLKMDEMLVTPEGRAEISKYMENEGADSMAGCTSNVLFIKGNTVYCANAGDSRSVLWDGRMIPLSEDHKPDNAIEKERISKAGGYIVDGRVNSNLNLSRAIGDLEYKKNTALKPTEQLISAEPDIVKRELTTDDKFILMGCDGVWEILTGTELCKIAEERLKENPNGQLSVIVEELLDKGLAPDTSQGVGCDNMSSILVVFNH